MLRLSVSLLSVIALAGCAVVDLAAHGVKRYEKPRNRSRRRGRQANSRRRWKPAVTTSPCVMSVMGRRSSPPLPVARSSHNR